MESSRTLAEQHLSSCYSCHKGVNCFTWYRLHQRTPDWCVICEVEHFSTVVEKPAQFGDVITVVENVLVLNNTRQLWERGLATRLDFMGRTAPGTEGIHWIRGHVYSTSPAANALLAAAALAA